MPPSKDAILNSLVENVRYYNARQPRLFVGLRECNLDVQGAACRVRGRPRSLLSPSPRLCQRTARPRGHGGQEIVRRA